MRNDPSMIVAGIWTVLRDGPTIMPTIWQWSCDSLAEHRQQPDADAGACHAKASHDPDESRQAAREDRRAQRGALSSVAVAVGRVAQVDELEHDRDQPEPLRATRTP